MVPHTGGAGNNCFPDLSDDLSLIENMKPAETKKGN